jgi:Flp pilus assembly protein TadG
MEISVDITVKRSTMSTRSGPDKEQGSSQADHSFRRFCLSRVSSACNRFATIRSRLLYDRDGHGLLELALALPMLIVIVVNAVNLGYILSVYLNLTTAPRQGVQYSVAGTTTTLGTAVPSADSVSSLVYENINTAVPGAANTPTRVCSVALGLSGSGSSLVPNCGNYGSGTGSFADVQSDPEAPYMVLNRVDVQYTLTTPLQGSPFNVVPPLTLHRMVTMRAMP